MPHKPLTEEEKLIASPFGKTIDYFRKQKGMSRIELADIAGIDRRSLYDIIYGIRIPNYKVVRNLSAALGMPVFVLEMILSDISNDELQNWFQFAKETRVYRSTILATDFDIEFNQENE